MITKFVITILVILSISWPFSILRARENITDITTLLLAQNIKMNLAIISSSVKALGNEYVRLYDQTPVMTEQDQQKWLARSFSDKQTVLFRPITSGAEPEFQASQPSYLYYHGKELSANVWRELNTFTRMSSMFKSTYYTFNDSWVYLTTADGAFFIYPYLPLNEAIHNYPPTQQVFYTAADFNNRTFGWTPPYLDLVGAGMMVTVSHPMYLQDKLLGVIARDITLTQLANQTLKPVTDSGNQLISLIIDKNGMAIANSQAEGMKEIKTINNKAKTAVLYYCDQKTLSGSTNAGAQSSARALYNQAGQLALEAGKSASQETLWQFTLKAGEDQYQASVAQIKTTGWFVITLQP